MKYEAFEGLSELIERNYPGLVIEMHDEPLIDYYFGTFVGYNDVKGDYVPSTRYNLGAIT